MFNLTPNPTFKAEVPISVPGLREPLEVPFTFKHLTKTGLQKWMARYAANPGHEVLAEVIADWGVRRDGELVEYSASALAELCENYPPALAEIGDAFVIELGRAKRKN